MNKYIGFFNPEGDMTLFEKQKAKAFIVLGALGFILVLVVILVNLVSPNENSAVSILSSTVLAIFILVSLFILKYFGIGLAGNVFSTGLILLLAGALNILKADIPAIYKFLQGFYTILAILCAGVLFASRKLLIINAVIVLLTTIRVYSFAMVHTPEQADMLRAGFINHTTAIAIITMLIYFAILFAERAIESANKEAAIKEQQNNKLSEIFVVIKETSRILEKLSGEIKSSAISLNSSSNQQAANVEEITSTIEEMTSAIIQNAEDTKTSANTVNNTTEAVQKSQLAVNQTLLAINNVDSKINLIQEIAKKNKYSCLKCGY